MHHEIVNASEWMERFPLDKHLSKLDAEGRPDFVYHVPYDIDTPESLAHMLQYIERALSKTRRAQAQPIDVFLPALGEPTRRHQTKFGGLPYISKEDWPRDDNGNRYAFLGQICFADSLDVLPVAPDKLGGDVLLLFQKDPEEMLWSMDDGDLLLVVWRPLGLSESTLVTADEAYVPDGWIEPVFFHRLRTHEYNRLKPVKHGRRKITVDGKYRATKLGGTPVWQQCDSEGEGLGTYIGCLHSINPYGPEFPMINVPIAPWGDRYSDLNLPMFGDVGTLYLFLSESAQVNWVMQCG
ncbi:MAG: DUF1963 domain-containing protein [Phycisphaerales bacterium]